MGGIVVTIAIVLTVVIVFLLVRNSQEKSHNLDKVESNKDVGLLAYDNAMYDVGKEIHACNAQNWQLH